MSACSAREAMLLRVQQLGFVTDDLRLFLNTHPQSQEALCVLRRVMALECAARTEYERQYGPLTLEGLQHRCGYDWIDGPWPWEMEA